ncbi:hypothetical protein IMZ08_18140 [Bacillus luteolus]|uniref:Lipoprotein n=1 Tax=Litchfieldia luteola TaxID=682179 RepID=A0ABR9QN77_9BACI|nr:hypothetical protein [Cytobacillus luteolus]MBE4909960.1 hypothetical protein [Cytobacillus luteolus]MBP1942483.1 hypothetical protein [Cytobacillus luteolus]
MRKSLVSLSAAALMVVGLTGCGMNDNNVDTFNNDRDARILDRGYHDNNDLNYRRGDTIDNEGPITEMMDDDNGRGILNNNNDNDLDILDNDDNNRNRNMLGGNDNDRNPRGTRPGGNNAGGTGTGGTR